MSRISRAGEAGKRFAVVANEVKAPAKQTAQPTQNIRDKIDGIQEVNEKVAHGSTVSGEIAKDISDVNQSANEMAYSSSQVNQNSAELANLAEKLKEMVERFKV